MPLPRTRDETFPASSSAKKTHLKPQQHCLGSRLPEQRGSGRGKVNVQKSRAIPRCVAVPAPSMGGPSLPTQVVQSRSLRRGDPPGLYLWPWHHQIINLIQLMALSDDADWQPVCFPRLGVFISLSKSQKTTSLPASEPVVRKPRSSDRRNCKKTTGKMSPDVSGGRRDLQGGPHRIQHSHQNQRKSSKKKKIFLPA